jgi:hypothetical protein
MTTDQYIKDSHFLPKQPHSVIQQRLFLFSLHLTPFQQFKFTICLAGLSAYFLFKIVAGP